MSANAINTAPYLRTSRKFPEDLKLLSTELTRGWIETANCVNQRAIGLFATSPTVTGNTYYITGPQNKQQSLQQLYTFSDTNLTIDHNITSYTTIFIAKSNYTDGTDFYSLDGTYPPLAGAISAKVTPTQIIIAAGPATPVTFSGYLILEWLCNT